MTEVIEVSDLDLALGKPLRSSGHRLLANAGCLCNDLLHPPCVQKVHGHGACVRRELRRPSGRSGRPARPASGAAPTEDGEAAVPLPNLRVLRRAEEHARVAHHQETSPGEWKPGHEGVATALSAPASHSVRTPSL